MNNSTQATRKRLLGYLKGKNEKAAAISKAFDFQAVRRALKSLERKDLVKRDDQDQWALTAAGEAWLSEQKA